MTGTFGGGHEDVDVGGRHDLLIADVEAVGKGDGVAGLQVGSDGLLINIGGALVVDQHHDDVGLFGGFRGGVDFKTVCHGLGPGFAAHMQADDHVAAAVAQVQRMGVTLGTIADDRDLLALEVLHVAVFFIVHLCIHVIAACHS